MNIETVKAAMIGQYKEMYEEFLKAPIIKPPIFTYLGPLWDERVVAQRCYAAGQCEGVRRLLKQILTEDEYNQLMSVIDDVTEK